LSSTVDAVPFGRKDGTIDAVATSATRGGRGRRELREREHLRQMVSSRAHDLDTVGPEKRLLPSSTTILRSSGQPVRLQGVAMRRPPRASTNRPVKFTTRNPAAGVTRLAHGIEQREA
jgi:hypothetical protein